MNARRRFYRTMLCIARTVLSQDVCPFVCLSHAGILSKRLILKLFSLSGSHTILVFSYQTVLYYSDGDPLTGASSEGTVWKNRDFRPIYRFISEMIQDKAIVTIEGE